MKRLLFILSSLVFINFLFAASYKIEKSKSRQDTWVFTDKTQYIPGYPVSQISKIMPLMFNVPYDVSAGQIEIEVLDKIYQETSTTRDLEVDYAGNFRGASVYTVRFYPVGQDAGGTFIITRGRLKINNIKSAKASYLKKDPAFSSIFGEDTAPVAFIDQKTALIKAEDRKKAKGNVKMYIEKKGLYRVYGSDLEEADVNLSEIDARSLRLYNRGREIPVLVEGEDDGKFDPEDYIEFFGIEKLYDLRERFDEAQDADLYFDPFTRYNVYWVDWSSGLGLRMVDESGEIRSNNPSEYFKNSFFVENIHFEKNSAFDALGTVDVNQLSFYRDHYFYDRGVAQGKKNTYTFTLEKPLLYSGSYDTFAGIKILLTGISTVAGRSHSASLFLNNTLIFQPFDGWQGQDFTTLENFTSISNIIFKDGENLLEISVPDQGWTDQVALNWFEVSYLKAYTAVNDILQFAISPESEAFPDRNIQQFEIDGFTSPDIRIYKKGLSRIQNFIKESYTDAAGELKYRIKFQDELINKDVEYYAVGGGQRLSPAGIRIETETFPEFTGKSLYDTDNAADYLIITHPNFITFAETFKQYRIDSNGFAAMVVDVEDIYDEFNYGIKSPLTIKDFISYVYYNWDQSKKLRYVVFFGDADATYKDNLQNLTDFVPTLLFQTYKRGASATDHEFALLEGVNLFNQSDSYADIFVGRVPVKSNTELQDYLLKVQEYESANNKLGEWKSRGLFISGNDAKTRENNLDGDPAFRAQNRRVIKSQFPNGMASYRLNTVKNDTLESDPDFGGTVTLSNYFNDGLSFINFLGHGGGGIWADVNLMNLGDVDRLLNKGKYPFITSMTCFTGQFESNSQPGLMEKMVLAKDKGAIAAFSSTGLGWLQNDYAILWDIVPEMMQNGLSFGETMVKNKAFYYLYHKYYADDFSLPVDGFGFLGESMVHQYNLIGDPAIKINIPGDELAVHLENQLFVDFLDLKLIIDDPAWHNSTGYYQVTDPDRRPLFERPLSIADNDTIALEFQGDFRHQWGFVNVYLNNGEKDGSTGIPFAIDHSIIDSVVFDPLQPETFKPINVTWFFNTTRTIESVEFKYTNYATTDLIKVSNTEFKLLQPIGPFTKKESLVYSLTLKYDDESQQKFSGMSIDVINNRPNIAVSASGIEVTGGDNIYLKYEVSNTGLIDADSFKVALFADGVIFAFDSLALSGREQQIRKVPFPFTLKDGIIEAKVYADYFNHILEPDISDNIAVKNVNVNRFYFDDLLGTSYALVQNDTIIVDNYLQIYASLNTIDILSTVNIDTIKKFEIDADFITVPIGSNGLKMVGLELDNVSASLTDSVFIAMVWDMDFVVSLGYAQSDVSLFEFNPKFNQWVKNQSVTFDTINGIAKFKTIEHSGFSFLIADDDSNPFIEVTVDGYSLNKASSTAAGQIFVSSNPKLSFVFQDDHGIKIGSSQFSIKLDDQPVEESELVFEGAVENARTIGLIYYPELAAGDHTLSVTVEDVNGNVEEKLYSFRVESNFRFDVIGVFPNPFDINIYNNTYVQFQLTKPVNPDDFKASLYTLGGRKIREFAGTDVLSNAGTIQNVNSLPWDGRDKNGSEVANGVYFMRFNITSQDGDQVEKVVKIAKIR